MVVDTFLTGNSSTRRSFLSHRRALQAALLFALTVLFSSCGLGKLGFGVVTWSPDQASVANGSLVTVHEKSDLSGTYTISGPASKGRLTVDAWRLRFFKSRREAEAFQKEFSPYVNIFARSNIGALPVRDKPDSSGRRIYGLRDQEIIKILGKTTEQEVAAGNLTGFWYHVQTETGDEGYTFSKMLTVYDALKGIPSVTETEMTLDDKIERFLSGVWRPDYFRTMIESGRLDLRQFSPQFGLFPDSETKTVKVVTPEFEAVFPFTRINRGGDDRYTLDQSSFSFTVKEEFISVQYSYNQREYSTAYVSVEENLDELIASELTTRKELFDAFFQKGTVFISTAYGSVTIAADQTFRWTGLDRLVPTVIPAAAGQEGYIEFQLGLRPELASTYDGAVSFHFSGLGNTRSVNFLYDFTQNGVKFVHVPDRDIAGTTVMREPSTPTVIFFSYGS